MTNNDSHIVSPIEHKLECSLNNKFGIGVQGVLAFSAFCILIVKRLREPKKERRPLRIWFCDTSKQGIGAMLIHFANVFLAELSHKDPCTLYFINFVLDTTIGLLVIWFALKTLESIAKKKCWMRLRMGEYGNPPEFTTWLYQCMAYICVMFIEKTVVLALLQLEFWGTIEKFILKPVSGYPKVEVVLVVLIVPFIMNALMFWVVDNFLMRKRHKLSSSASNEDIAQSVGNHRHFSRDHGDDQDVKLRLIADDSLADELSET